MNRSHLTEYAIEAGALGAFLVSASGFAVLLEHPTSPVRQVLHDPFLRRLLMGMAMGLTLVAIVYSPWGRRSGAHMNPVLTLTFFRLGRVARADALGYAVAQFAGAIASMAVLHATVGAWLAHPAVSYVTTRPGTQGAAVAFAAEAAISFGMMLLVLTATSVPRVAPFTGVLAGSLVAAYIAFEAPVSGMSMNPARTFGPAIVSGLTDALWIYFAAPALGMFGAAQLFVAWRGHHNVACAKYQHDLRERCIHCGWDPDGRINQQAVSSNWQVVS